MSSNIFFKKKNINIGKIFPNLKEKNDFIINGIRPLKIAQKNDITFLLYFLSIRCSKNES